MNIDQYKESEIENGNADLLNVTKTTELAKKIQPMSKSELTIFQPMFIESVANAALSKVFVKSLAEVFVKKQIDVGIFDKSEKNEAVRDLVEEISQYKNAQPTSQAFNRLLTKDHQTLISTSSHPIFVANFIVSKRKIATNNKGLESQVWTIEYLDQCSQQARVVDIPISVSDRSKPTNLQEKIGTKYSDVRITMDFDLFNRFISLVLDQTNVPIEKFIVRNSYGLHVLNNVPLVLHQKEVSTDYGIALEDAILSPHDHKIKDVIYEGSLESCLYSFPQGDFDLLAQQLEVLLNSYLKMITKNKALTALGWYSAAAIKKQISMILNECNLPILKLFSKPGVGKSVIITALARAFGYVGPRNSNGDDETGGATGKEYLFGMTTIPTIRELLASHNNLPVIIGEYRSDQKHSSQFENMILGAFDGMGGGKMKATNNEHKIQDRPLTAPLILMGNDRLVDDASQTRLLLIHLLEKDKDQPNNKEHMNNLLSLKGGYCGTAIYSWLVNNWDNIEQVILEGAAIASKSSKGTHRLNAASTCVAIGLVLLRRVAEFYRLDTSMISDEEIQKAVEFIQTHVGENVNETIDRKFVHFVVERLQSHPTWFKVIDDEVILDTKWIALFHEYLQKHKVSSVNLIAISTLLKKELPEVFSTKKKAMHGSNTQERLAAQLSVLIEKYDLEKDSFVLDPLTI